MRNNSNSRRMRPRNNGRGGNGNSNGGGKRVNPKVQTFDSNGPEVRVRGTAYQISDKYLSLAKDAASAGDRVLAESYLQHAEHYQRFIAEMTERFEQYRQYQSEKDKPDREEDDNDEVEGDLEDITEDDSGAEIVVAEVAVEVIEEEVKPKIVLKPRGANKKQPRELEEVTTEA